MNDNLIINFAPTGAVATKKMSQHLPVSQSEIIETVHQACEIGITVLHLHARDKNGSPTNDPDIYGQLICKIRSFAPELVICVSTSGRFAKSTAERMAVLKLDGTAKPDMATLTPGSLNFSQQASINTPEAIVSLASEMKFRRIKPELEVFDAGMINYGKYLIRKGLLEAPYYFNLLVGNISTSQFDLSHIGLMQRDLPRQSYWALAGIGDTNLAANSLGIIMGGGVRVGLEDHLYLDRRRTKLATNNSLLLRIHKIGEMHERKVMHPLKFRQLLHLHQGNGSYGMPPEKIITLEKPDNNKPKPGTAKLQTDKLSIRKT